MSYSNSKKEYEVKPNFYCYPPPQVASNTVNFATPPIPGVSTSNYAVPPIPGVSSTLNTKNEDVAANPPLPPEPDNFYNYVCKLPPPPPPPPPPGNEKDQIKHAYQKASYATEPHSSESEKFDNNSYAAKYAGSYASLSSAKPASASTLQANYHKYSANYSYPPPPAQASDYSTANSSYEYHSTSYHYDYDVNYYPQSHYGTYNSRHHAARPPRGDYYARTAAYAYSKSDQYYDKASISSSSYSDSGKSEKLYVGKRHRQRDERPPKSETERDRLLRNWRSNYCETSEEIQRKMDELAEMDEESREVWIRSSPADPYYKRTNNVHEVEATTRLEMLCQLFEEKLINRAEKIRSSMPPYNPPPRQTRRRVCKHKSEGCTSSDTDSSDNEEFKLEQDTCMEELSRKLQHPYRIHADLWHNEHGEMNDGPLCRCSVRSRRVGIRHGIYPGENGYPKCELNSNNAHKLHHYRITISPPTNFLTKTPTIIKHDEHEFLFEGFSLFSHFPLMDLPTCKVIRFNIEYTILYVPEKMPENFTVRELDLFCKLF